MSEYVFRHVDTAFKSRHIVSATSKTGIADALQHRVLFICREIVSSERRRGKLVENKERHFQAVAKGKYASTLYLCLSHNENHVLKTVYDSLHLK